MAKIRKKLTRIVLIPVAFVIVYSLIGAQLQYVGASSDKSDEEENPDNDNFDEPSGCYAAGYEDGQTGPFDTEVYHDNCEGEGRYYDGFIDGCIDEGNTRDVCISATDA